jgi:hypothetical protein
MHTRLLLALTGALLIVRLPSLVQPLGPDQGIYAYIGERILHGELAYRDAWDQKPPGIHYVYAGLRHLSRRDLVMPAADLAVAAMIAALLWTIGARLGGPIAGGLSAVVFLLLSDPSFSRLGGVRVRAQCETFIALAVAAAVANAIPQNPGAWRRIGTFIAGVLIGAAFALKYNAALYGLVVLAALALTSGVVLADVFWLVAGATLIPLALLIAFWRGGALGDLYQATIVYNLRYSGETYASRLQMLTYLGRFPVQHARVDALWFVGGIGCLVLLVAGIRRRLLWVPVLWVAVACASIAINGSRGLPQYFVQAAPALGLAAGVGLVTALAPMPRVLRWLLVGLLAFGVWRVADFPKLASNVAHDVRYIFGRIDRRTHLARYGGQRDEDKYSALDNLDIGTYLAAHTRPDETVFVFGFSPGSYVYANRRSASRFFWSRPVIYNFNGTDPRYGARGLLTDLRASSPAFVVLQRHDWAPDVQDSEPFFLSQPPLAEWLHANYHELPAAAMPSGFGGWERNGRQP